MKPKGRGIGGGDRRISFSGKKKNHDEKKKRKADEKRGYSGGWGTMSPKCCPFDK